jgi:hypothetical protein
MSIRRALDLAVVLLVSAGAYGELHLPLNPVVEATEPGGAIVTFPATVVGAGDGGDGRPTHTVTCTPPSFSLFPLGTTTVNCVGSEGSTGSFTITVVDTLPPALFLPRNLQVVTTGTEEIVTFSATAADLVDGSVAVACTPPSGSSFALGVTPVSCTATDSHGNSSTGSFEVEVATEPGPPGENPDDITAEATGPDGARVSYPGAGSDPDGRPTSGCSPASGSLFPFGPTTVTCGPITFVVTVVDTTPPELTLPESPLVAISTTAVEVTFSATATDLVDGSVGLTCTSPSGSTFALGTTTVSCTASDVRGNSVTGEFDVLVAATPPSPNDLTAEATGPDGAVVTFGFSCSPASGSTFPLGMTTVNCSGGLTFTVTVEDSTPPDLVVPGDLVLHAVDATGAVGTFTATATDIVDGIVAVVCEPPSGTLFPLGANMVNCSATDAHANTAGDQFLVTVIDADPPVFVSLTASPDTIWPPNNKMVAVTLTAVVEDNVDPLPAVQIVDVTANETITGDFTITGALTLNLRAERDGNGSGRVYTVWVEAVDAAGNRSVSTVDVTVPHDQSSKRRSAKK